LHLAKGRYVIFLDADDWFLPGALSVVEKQIEIDPEAAMVIGGYVNYYEDATGIRRGESHAPVLGRDPYAALLRRNVVQMHAAVAYKRSAVEACGGFDEELNASEDYDMLLRVAKNYPVRAYETPVTAYRRRRSSMSTNPIRMIKATLAVLQKHRATAQKDAIRHRAFKEGMQHYKEYYGTLILQNLRKAVKGGDQGAAWKNAAVLTRKLPDWIMLQTMRYIARKTIPPGLQRTIRKLLGREKAPPPPGQIDMGDLRNIHPVSRHWGFDRGTPVDRYYIEGFLDAHRHDIAGRTLEIGDRTYTRRFGDDRVTDSDVLHFIEGNEEATFVGDLTDAPHLQSNTFDCIILTETLQLIFDVSAALNTLQRILRPGGVLLITVPGVTPTPQDVVGEGWFWSFTDVSLRKLLEQHFPKNGIYVESYGNVLSAISMLEGIAHEELTPDELDHQDKSYQVTVAARVQKEERE